LLLVVLVQATVVLVQVDLKPQQDLQLPPERQSQLQ
jgi:hypothetical protein